MKEQELYELLEREAVKRDRLNELDASRPDPLMVARRYEDEYIALVCALFAYGNAKQIVSFLESLPFWVLDAQESELEQALQKHYYRFQKPQDVIALFKALRRLKHTASLEEIFMRGYGPTGSVIEGLNALTGAVRKSFEVPSRGYDFLVGRSIARTKGSGAMKRWMMFLRWMVRKDALDMGLWKEVKRRDLVMPLDTHTFHVSHRLGLLERRSCDLHAALELTQRLKRFDRDDPVKYDFALYRLGQERLM